MKHDEQITITLAHHQLICIQIVLIRLNCMKTILRDV